MHPFWASGVGRGLKKTLPTLPPNQDLSDRPRSALCRLLSADWDCVVLKGRLCVPPTHCPPIAGTAPLSAPV